MQNHKLQVLQQLPKNNPSKNQSNYMTRKSCFNQGINTNYNHKYHSNNNLSSKSKMNNSLIVNPAHVFLNNTSICQIMEKSDDTNANKISKWKSPKKQYQQKIQMNHQDNDFYQNYQCHQKLESTKTYHHHQNYKRQNSSSHSNINLSINANNINKNNLRYQYTQNAQKKYLNTRNSQQIEPSFFKRQQSQAYFPQYQRSPTYQDFQKKFHHKTKNGFSTAQCFPKQTPKSTNINQNDNSFSQNQISLLSTKSFTNRLSRNQTYKSRLKTQAFQNKYFTKYLEEKSNLNNDASLNFFKEQEKKFNIKINAPNSPNQISPNYQKYLTSKKDYYSNYNSQSPNYRYEKSEKFHKFFKKDIPKANYQNQKTFNNYDMSDHSTSSCLNLSRQSHDFQYKKSDNLKNPQLKTYKQSAVAAQSKNKSSQQIFKNINLNSQTNNKSNDQKRIKHDNSQGYQGKNLKETISTCILQPNQVRSILSPKASPKSKNFDKSQKSTNQKRQNNGFSFFRKSKNQYQQQKIPQKQFIKQSQNQIKREQFTILKKLGEGKFGKVYLTKDNKTGFIMGMKVLQKEKIKKDNMIHQLIRELKIQSYLDHPNIIKLYGIFDDYKNIYVLLELGCDGQLYKLMQRIKTKKQLQLSSPNTSKKNFLISQEGVSFITHNLLEGVNYMHSKSILHRDIKPENIVLSHGTIKFCDLGWAVNLKDQLRSTFCGTPLYLSPQILIGQAYNEKVDLWAIGVLSYQMHFGQSPFQITAKQHLQRIITHDVYFPSQQRENNKSVKKRDIRNNQQISTQFKQFINAILQKNPKQRLSSKQLLKLNFISQYNEFETCSQLLLVSSK